LGKRSLQKRKKIMIYKKIKAAKKANLLRKTKDPKDGDIVNIDGDAHTYIKDKLRVEGSSKPDVKKAISGGTAGVPWETTMKNYYKDGASIADLVNQGHGTTEGLTNLFKGLTQGSNTPGSTTITTDADPLTQTIKKGPTQRYNMGERAVEDANWAKGRMRRGLNREERKGMKDIVKGLDPKQRQEFRDNMKKQRNVDLDGDGKVSLKEKLKGTFGGNRQQKKLNALNAIDGGSVKQEFGLKDKTIRQDIAKAAQGAYDFGDRANMSERDKKIEAASQSKYSFGLDNFGDFKAGSTTTGNMKATDDMEVVDRSSLGTTTVFDSENGMQTVNKSNPFSGMNLNPDDYKIELGDAFKFPKRGYKPKNSAIAKKLRDGAGY
jgi:hypothetical protein